MIHLRRLGCRAYPAVLQAMRDYTDARCPDSADELWLVEHPSVFTQGLNGKPEHVLNPGDIPVIPVDRGGQVTYHGPGQVVVYCLIDVRRAHLGVRDLVTLLEQTTVELLAAYGIHAYAKADAPGVYVGAAKIASLGLRVRRGCSYHGLSLNVAMDLEPFTRINPCGYAGLAMTQLADLGINASPAQVGDALLARLCTRLGQHDSLTLTALPDLLPQEPDPCPT